MPLEGETRKYAWRLQCEKQKFLGGQCEEKYKFSKTTPNF